MFCLLFATTFLLETFPSKMFYFINQDCQFLNLLAFNKLYVRKINLQFKVPTNIISNFCPKTILKTGRAFSYFLDLKEITQELIAKCQMNIKQIGS